MPDIFEDVKRASEVADRPGKTSPVPLPHELSNEYSGASYKMAAPKAAKPKSDEEKSLEWNAQQRKVAEGQ
jgi:hypothetical protein